MRPENDDTGPRIDVSGFEFRVSSSRLGPLVLPGLRPSLPFRALGLLCVGRDVGRKRRNAVDNLAAFQIKYGEFRSVRHDELLGC